MADLGVKNAMILRNHGLLVCAPTIPQAFNLIYWLEQACKIQIDILSCGRALHAAARGGREHGGRLGGDGDHAEQRGQHQSARQVWGPERADRLWSVGMACAETQARSPGCVLCGLTSARVNSVDRDAAIDREDLSRGDLGLI